MQMREQKYIRFDFTQALHTRATSAERRDYRIIARTRTSDPSLMRALARAVHSVATAYAFAREASAQQPTQVRSIPDFPIYCASLRDSRRHVQEPFLALAELRSHACGDARSNSIRRDERIKSKRPACSSQSNFSWWSSSDFCRSDVASAASPRESRRESSDSNA
jgi:hypothetical protein